MARLTLTAGAIVLALGATLCGTAAAADAQPRSLLQLFNQLPKTPFATQDAVALVDTAQQMPAIAVLKAELAAHSAAVGEIVGAADAKIRARMGGGSADQPARVAAAAGIDMARMQTDKAYAAEMQARMKTMPPHELMAMMAAMSPGTGRRGTVAVYDPPAVKAAADAGQALMQPEQVAARLATSQFRWTGVDKKVAAINAKYDAKWPKMRLSCDGEGGGRPECVAERARYAEAVRPLLRARNTEVLRAEAAALEEERTALAGQVRMAEPHLLAAQYGAASQELGNPQHIANLDAHIVTELTSLALRLEAAVKRAAVASLCEDKYVGTAAECSAKQ